jgi:hypothetical protein
VQPQEVKVTNTLQVKIGAWRPRRSVRGESLHLPSGHRPAAANDAFVHSDIANARRGLADAMA